MFNKLTLWIYGPSCESKSTGVLMEEYKHEHSKQVLANKFLFNIFLMSLTVIFTIFGFLSTRLFDMMFESEKELKTLTDNMLINVHAFSKIFTYFSIVGVILMAFFAILSVFIIVRSRKDQYKIERQLHKNELRKKRKNYK